MPKVVHFEIYADEIDRAVGFYADVFGWQFQTWEGAPVDYRLAVTGPDDQPGINGAIMARPDPSAAGVNYIDVPSIDEYTKKVVAQGGSVVMQKMAIPGVGYAAVCNDTEGNSFGLFQSDPSAQS